VSRTVRDKDQNYIIDLCDELLGLNAHREYRFDFLRGDPGRNGIGRKLPVDAYYASLALVVEYHEIQHRRSVPHFDKPDRLTVSGVHRGLQRALYDQRRRDVLPQHGISLLEISSDDFACDTHGRLQRSPADRDIVRACLRDYLG
jgi:hypothetical protein